MAVVRTKFEQTLGWGILVLLLAGCVLVLWPFVTALLWAAVLSYSSWPLFEWLVRRLKGRRTLAALVMLFLMICVLLLPFVTVGLTLGDNVAQLKGALQRLLSEGTPAAPGWLAGVPVVGGSLSHRWEQLAADSGQLMQTARRFIEPVAAWSLRAGLTLGAGVLQLTLSIFITVFLLRNGSMVATQVAHAVERVGGDRGRHLLGVAGDTVRGVVYGILGTALVQAVMAGFGFLIAGVPGAMLLALLTFFLSIIPLGPPLIWLPAAFWLFHQGNTGWGIFMLIWGVGVSTIDNFVKPWLISQGSDLPFLLILFGVLGGALAFGFIGVFIGPTLLALAYRLVKEWAAMVPSSPLEPAKAPAVS